MRFHASWMLLRQATGSAALPSWVVSVVQATIKGVCATVVGRVAQIHRESGDIAAHRTEEEAARCLGKSEVACLGLHAFIAVFTMRRKWYASVVPALRRLLEQHNGASQSEGNTPLCLRLVLIHAALDARRAAMHRCIQNGIFQRMLF
jgi:hypothetical protein